VDSLLVDESEQPEESYNEVLIPILNLCDKEERSIFCVLTDPKKIATLLQYNFVELHSTSLEKKSDSLFTRKKIY